jgi:hypothetical protein
MKVRALLFLLVCGYCMAQGSTGTLTFRKCYIGMPLAEFRDAYAHRVSLSRPVQSATGNTAKPATEAYFADAPLCNDQVQNPSVGLARQEDPRELTCVIDLPDEPNALSLTVGGIPSQHEQYHFRDGRLVSILGSVEGCGFRTLQRAFLEKYGRPTEFGHASYANASGARWTGEEDTWDKGAVIVSISEGPGYGPMEDCAQSVSVFTIHQKGERIDTQPSKPLDF